MAKMEVSTSLCLSMTLLDMVICIQCSIILKPLKSSKDLEVRKQNDKSILTIRLDHDGKYISQ